MEQLPNSDIDDLEDEYAYEDDYLVKAIIGVVVNQNGYYIYSLMISYLLRTKLIYNTLEN